MDKKRSRGWCFTLFNYCDNDVQVLSQGGSRPDDVLYLVFGKEVCPKTGTPHLQGFLYAKTLKSFKQAKAYVSDGAHLEPQKGSNKQAIEYCKKDGSFTEYGTAPNQGKRTDLEAVTEMILAGSSLSDVAMEHPTVYVKFHRGLRDLKLTVTRPYTRESVCGVWIYGEPGTGKSHYAQTLYPNAYRKSQSKWFDGYAGEKEIILDDLDTNMLCHHLKIWTDKWSCTGETKGGTVHLMHDVFVVTSNYKIRDLVPKKSKDEDDEAMIGAIERRFKQLEIKKEFWPPTGNVGAGEYHRILVDENGETDLGVIQE